MVNTQVSRRKGYRDVGGGRVMTGGRDGVWGSRMGGGWGSRMGEEVTDSSGHKDPQN